jgi:hypothetical protein
MGGVVVVIASEGIDAAAVMTMVFPLTGLLL